MKSQDLKKLNLPDNPGVYFWKKGKEILYIGKATSLRDRVRSYFAKDLIQTRGPAILDMVMITDTIEYEKTDTVLEALMLEANLIKKHQPKYNVKEKDNKSFTYVVITDEPFPRVGTVRGRTLTVQKQLDALPVKIKYTFGPFPSYSSLLGGMRILRKIFPFRDMKSTNPTHDRFYQQLQLSPDHTNSEVQKTYSETIKHIVQFFKGNKKGIINDLKKKMNQYAKDLRFEEAEMAKRQMWALEHINDISLIKRDFYEDQPLETFRIESYDIAHISGTSTVGVMIAIENGHADKTGYRKFKIHRVKEGSVNELASLKEVLERRFSHPEWPFPNLVAVDGGQTHFNHARKILDELGHKDILLASVVKDERHRPKGIIGPDAIIKKHKTAILLANSESHRFAIAYHKDLRGRHFLK
jgi:excinuclease ABC subunit C